MILINFASRERPTKFFACLNNIREMSTTGNYIVLAKLDIDDCSMNCPESIAILEAYPEVQVAWGYSKNKRDAINRDINTVKASWTILLNHSDDMQFTYKGFDEEIFEAFKGYSGLVHFPDQKAGAELITYTMMSRDYYESEGFVYHHDFSSVYMDNYQHEKAIVQGKYKYVPKEILFHAHPIWGHGVVDNLLLRTEEPENYRLDHLTYQRHKQNNFGI